MLDIVKREALLAIEKGTAFVAAGAPSRTLRSIR